MSYIRTNGGNPNGRRRLKPEEADLARELRARDPKIYSWRELGRMFGTSDYQVHSAVHPETLKVRNDAQKMQYAQRVAQARESGRFGGDPELAWLRAQRPPDTRDLTGRLLNDPLPGRSALDRKHAANPDRSALAQRDQGARS